MGRNKHETAFQRDIIKALEAQGGAGGKWSSEFKVGPPDLILSHDHFSTCLAEVKVLREVEFPLHKFTRKVEVTDIQDKWLRNFWTSGSFCAVLVVLDGGNSRKRSLVACPPWVRRLTFEPEDYERNIEMFYPVEVIPHGGTLDVVRLLTLLRQRFHEGVYPVPDPEWEYNSNSVNWRR